MLPRKQRVSVSLFQTLFRKSRAYQEENLMLRVSPIPASGLPLGHSHPEGEEKGEKKVTAKKFAFVVSKKVSKKAIDRNRLRRQGYAIIEKYQREIRNGFAYIFLFKKSAKDISFLDLEKEIQALLKKSHSFE